MSQTKSQCNHSFDFVPMRLVIAFGLLATSFTAALPTKAAPFTPPVGSTSYATSTGCDPSTFSGWCVLLPGPPTGQPATANAFLFYWDSAGSGTYNKATAWIFPPSPPDQSFNGFTNLNKGFGSDFPAPPLDPDSGKGFWANASYLDLERGNPPGAVDFTDDLKLTVFYDVSAGLQTSPNNTRPTTPDNPDDPRTPPAGTYEFKGYPIIAVGGTYTSPSKETYTIPLQAPTPAGSQTKNASSRATPTPGNPPGINDLLAWSPVAQTWSGYWEKGTLGNPLLVYPADLEPHNLTDNLFNPDGGFVGGVWGVNGLPDDNQPYNGAGTGRLNGELSYGGFQFFVDYGIDYAADGYPNRYLPYQFFFRNLKVDDPNGVDYAGCPGDCGVAKKLPAPLPIFGAAAAFGSIRRLRTFTSQLKNHTNG